MSLTLQDEDLAKQIREIAERRKVTPEQVVADAIAEQHTSAEGDAKRFWRSIQGMGDSNDPSTANRAKEILRNEIEETKGWNAKHGTNSSD